MYTRVRKTACLYNNIPDKAEPSHRRAVGLRSFLHKCKQKKFTEQEVRQETQDYIGALNEAINEDRVLHGKKPLRFEEDEIKETSE